VTFERGFETDPMGSYLASLERVAALDPSCVLPGPRRPVPATAPAEPLPSRGTSCGGWTQIREMVEARERTVTELTAELFPTVTTAAQRHFAMAEILAYLAHHEVRGVLARARRPDGVFVWRPAGSEVGSGTGSSYVVVEIVESDETGRVP
jgi:hypothetical protein